MMMYEFNDFKTEYLNWLHQNIELVALNENKARLTAPFLDINNDYIELYIIKNGNDYILTDIGETIANLELSNFKIKENSFRQTLLKSLVSSYGMSLKNDEIYIECTINDFAIKANSLMQCMIKVSDMLLLSDNNVKTIFSEDVQSFFDENKIIYMSNISILGKSALYTKYDFVLPKTDKKPERFIVPINSINETVVKSTIFSWEDVKEKRDSGSLLYTLINDTGKTPASDNLTALSKYDIRPILWSKRKNNIELLKS